MCQNVKTVRQVYGVGGPSVTHGLTQFDGVRRVEQSVRRVVRRVEQSVRRVVRQGVRQVYSIRRYSRVYGRCTVYGGTAGVRQVVRQVYGIPRPRLCLGLGIPYI